MARTPGSTVVSAVAEPGNPLPPSPVPMGSYVPAVVHAGLVVTAGMTPRRNGVLVLRGRVGTDLDLEQARAACALAAANALAAAAAAAGGLDAIAGLLGMTVYICCTDDFSELSAVADGASDRLAEILGAGPRSQAVRAAIGVQSLPGGAPVEVQLIAACRQEARGSQ